jgi:tetratricopeptide (TPR) repeat protein
LRFCWLGFGVRSADVCHGVCPHLQDRRRIRDDGAIGRDELHQEFGLATRGTGQDELQIAEAAAAHGQWADAAKAYAEITMNPPVPIDVWYHRAIACLQCGDRATYREVCESMIDRVEMNPLNLPPINLVAWMCALGPDAIADSRRTLILADFLLAHLPDEPTTRHAYLNTIGGVFLRTGHYEEAVKRLNEGIAATDDGGTKQDWLLLALAYQQLSRHTEARQSLARMPANSPLNRRDNIWDSAEIELLQKEVERAMSRR